MDPDEFRARMIDANIPDMALFSDTPAEPSKQVEQEQKQKDQAQKQEEEDDESPFRASSLIPEPSAPDPTPTGALFIFFLLFSYFFLSFHIYFSILVRLWAWDPFTCAMLCKQESTAKLRSILWQQ